VGPVAPVAPVLPYAVSKIAVDGVPVVVFTLRRLAACPLISKFLVATHADEIGPLHQRIAAEHLSRPVRVLPGGDTRQESVAKALAEVPPETEFVLVHDAVRPLVTRDQVERVRALRARRDPAPWNAALGAVEDRARSGGNLVAAVVEAVLAQATVGEVSGRLRAVFGEHRETLVL